MKKGKTAKMSGFKNSKITYGTVDSKNFKSLYLNLQTWVEPKYDVENDSVKFEISMDETFMEGGDNPIPKDVTNDEYKILTKMYKTWLEYVYDEDEMFNYLLYKIDTLKTYVDSTGNKIEFIYWTDLQNKKHTSAIYQSSISDEIFYDLVSQKVLPRI